MIPSRYIAPRLGGLSARLALRVRTRIFDDVMAALSPVPGWRVLDVGVTSDRSADSNFFEALYPYKNQLTAVGLEDASFLEDLFPGVRFVRADGRRLPFADLSFDLTFCSAVIEHVGAHSEQERLLRELLRVSRRCVVTTPNRWFPVEFHTLTPLLHWLPQRWFRQLLRWRGERFFCEEANLNLLDERDLKRLIAGASFGHDIKVSFRNQRLLGLESNLVAYLERH
ncbi:hypothetical protein ICNINCKA_01960 [Synechococcus sp. CBW1107]|nr:hypothetical protein ICNINCKA_01960 [Synechococcus sp. CBW1107]